MVDSGETGGSDSGEGSDRHPSQSPRRRNRYQRHTDEQIQRLEGLFNECDHPNTGVKMQLGRELGLSIHQIKYWFQNRRTQLKTQQGKIDNVALRAENDKLQHEINAIREALERDACPSCGGPDQVGEDTYINDQNLRIEHAHLKEELQRISQLRHGIADGPSSSRDLIYDNSSTIDMVPFGYVSADFDKSCMVDIARNAMDELIVLLKSNEPFWMNSSFDGRKVLNLEVYENIFPRAIKSPNVWIESSQDSSIVFMNSLALVETFMDANKWMEVFPTIVSKARTIQVIIAGLMGSQNGLLQLMYEETQVLSPLVPTHKFYFLRFCRQIEQNSWAVVDVSYDIPQVHSNAECRARRLPSGCYIEDMPNGHSKITWMEHMQIEDRRPVHNFYWERVYSGLAFGAERRLASLQRICERLMCQMDPSTSFPGLGGGNPSPHGKRCLMKLSHRMVSIFCSSINPDDGQQWMISKMNNYEVHTTLKKCTNPDNPNSGVLNGVTTIWLPFSPQKIFDFLRNEHNRPQWDIVPDYNFVQEVGRIASGSQSQNCISILRGFSNSQDSKFIIEESCCIDPSAALVVYSPVDRPAINIALSGEDISSIPLYPSGFVISPYWKTPGEMSDGALVTIVLQTFESNATSGKIRQECASTVNKFVGITIKKIKAALNSSTL